MSALRIAVTMGDPAGIGPEVVVKALADPLVSGQAEWIVVGDEWVLRQCATQAGVALPPSARVLDLAQVAPRGFETGKVNASCGRAALAYVHEATRLCLEGQAQAMVTGPLSKESVALGGIPFSGHTEYIAALCGATEVRMLLVSERLRVVHVTTHIPLREACNVDTGRVLRTIELGWEALRRMGFGAPRIAVCGLNPHAGEGGLFGEEDTLRILPAVQGARAEGICCDGPLPPDTVFLKAVRGQYDLVVAMYHDQGHIPMKLLDFDRGVNVSLGLPLIRTSVDHGTAFDIAGRNQADPGSMKAALRLAVEMAARSAPGRGGE